MPGASRRKDTMDASVSEKSIHLKPSGELSFLKRQGLEVANRLRDRTYPFISSLPSGRASLKFHSFGRALSPPMKGAAFRERTTGRQAAA